MSVINSKAITFLTLLFTVQLWNLSSTEIDENIDEHLIYVAYYEVFYCVFAPNITVLCCDSLVVFIIIFSTFLNIECQKKKKGGGESSFGTANCRMLYRFKLNIRVKAPYIILSEVVCILY